MWSSSSRYDTKATFVTRRVLLRDPSFLYLAPFPPVALLDVPAPPLCSMRPALPGCPSFPSRFFCWRSSSFTCGVSMRGCSWVRAIDVCYEYALILHNHADDSMNIKEKGLSRTEVRERPLVFRQMPDVTRSGDSRPDACAARRRSPRSRRASSPSWPARAPGWRSAAPRYCR